MKKIEIKQDLCLRIADACNEQSKLIIKENVQTLGYIPNSASCKIICVKVFGRFMDAIEYKNKHNLFN